MEEISKITSLQNPRVKGVVKLRERREREKTGKFLVEGYRELLRAVEGNGVLETLFYSPAHFLGSNEEELIDRIASFHIELIEVSKDVFSKLSYRDRPDGLLAIANQVHAKLEELELSDPPLILVAEAIEKPGNLGSILRSCDAAGVDALLVCDRCTDIHNPNVIRSSIGTFFTVPVIETSSEEALKWLRMHQIPIVSSSPDAKEIYTNVDQAGPIALAVGTEQLGLSDLWMDAANTLIKIPMLGQADSLNVAAATTLLLYEVIRQRSLISR
jgi:TrmH family RNA methyltransferase